MVPLNDAINQISMTLPVTSRYPELVTEISKHIGGVISPFALIMALVGVFLALGIRIFIASRADYIYRGHVISTIKKVKADDNVEDLDYELSRRGGINAFMLMLMFYVSLFIGDTITMLLIS